MALHYRSARYVLSVRKKHEILEMLGRCGVFATWDDVSKEVLDDVAVLGPSKSRGAVQKDKRLSGRPLLASDLRPRFQVIPADWALMQLLPLFNRFQHLVVVRPSSQVVTFDLRG